MISSSLSSVLSHQWRASFRSPLSYVRISRKEYCLNSLWGAGITCWGARKGCSYQHVSYFEPHFCLMIVGHMWSLERSSDAALLLPFLQFRDNYSSLHVAISLFVQGLSPRHICEWNPLRSWQQCRCFQRFTPKFNINTYIADCAT